MKTITYDDTKWKLVPVEATKSMRKSVQIEMMSPYGMSHGISASFIYDIMLSVAPQPPETPINQCDGWSRGTRFERGFAERKPLTRDQIAQMLVDSHSTAYIVIQIDLPQLINPLDQMVEETLANKYLCTSAQINELRSKVKLIVIVDYHVECCLSFFVVSS